MEFADILKIEEKSDRLNCEKLKTEKKKKSEDRGHTNLFGVYSKPSKVLYY